MEGDCECVGLDAAARLWGRLPHVVVHQCGSPGAGGERPSHDGAGVNQLAGALPRKKRLAGWN